MMSNNPSLETSVPQRNWWVVNATTDLSCITLGWLLFFFAPYLLPQYFEEIRIISVAFLFGTHRYFTFLLVYLDRSEFSRHPKLYIWIPILCFVFVGVCYYFKIEEPEMFAVWYLFNFYHFVRQKYGILRIYSGKAGGGHKRLDEWTIYIWSAAGFLQVFASGADIKAMDYLSYWFGGTPPQVIPQTLYAIAIVLTVLWLVHEFRSPGRPSVPKLLFLGSVIFLYGIGPTLSAGAIYIATSVNHASEYIALVALTILNKDRVSHEDAPLLNRATGHIVRNTFLMVGALCALLYVIKSLSLFFFLFFAYGTSFAHFVLDGYIWKLRRPKVAREVGAATAG